MKRIKLSDEVMNRITMAHLQQITDYAKCKVATEQIVEFISNNYRRRKYAVKKSIRAIDESKILDDHNIDPKGICIKCGLSSGAICHFQWGCRK